MLRRIAPAVGLFFLSPLVAEFLLGNLSIASIAGLLFLAPMYGGGALLIREVARRTGRGWPTIILLALAYGIVEEGLVTQSLFNPHYAGQSLLSHGYIDALGMGSWWTLFVLTLHTVWSISVPIALVEAFVPSRRTTPWLGKVGLPVIAVVFVLGCLLNFAGSLDQSQIGGSAQPFFASPAQFAGSAAAAVVLVVAAFSVGRREPKQVTGSVPSQWIVGGVALVASSVFFVLPQSLPTWLICACYLVLYTVVAFLALRWSRRSGWSHSHTVALAGGALLTYAWHGFLQPSLDRGDSPVDLLGNAFFAAIALLVLILAQVRIRTFVNVATL
jgi:hypothetical protein